MPLKKTGNRVGLFWMCCRCDGRAITINLLRKLLPPNIVNTLWQKARIGEGIKAKRCPSCRRVMLQIPVVLSRQPEFLDVCVSCHVIWFDAGEYERFPKLKIAEPAYEQLSDKAKEAVAMANLELVKMRSEPSDGASTPDNWWEYILGFFGMPVEYNEVPLRQKPIVTWALTAVIAAVSIIAMFNLDDAVTKLGLIPEQFTRYMGFTFISSFFLHAGIIHLIGNLYFLLVFGDNVEDLLGKTKYLLLIFLSAIFGDIAHILCEPSSTIPAVGASGGISGIMAYYCFKFPKARVGILFCWYFIYIRWIRMPVTVMFALWILIQISYAFMQTRGLSNIAAFAHLGGAAIGVLFWLFTRNSTPAVEQSES